jgi:hypothetical protein
MCGVHDQSMLTFTALTLRCRRCKRFSGKQSCPVNGRIDQQRYRLLIVNSAIKKLLETAQKRCSVMTSSIIEIFQRISGLLMRA